MKSKLFKTILLALVFRLVLMRTTMHADLIFIHYFPSFFSLQGVLDIYGHLGQYYLKNGFTYYPPLLYFIIGFFQLIFKNIIPNFEAFFQNAHTCMFSFVTTNYSYLQPFYGKGLGFIIFFMKFPYLVFELALLFIISKFIKSENMKESLIRFWALNPVILFSCYIMGQYRMISSVMMSLGLLCLFRNKKRWACFIFGCVLCLDNYPMLLFLPSILLLSGNFKERLWLVLSWAIAPICIILPLYISSEGYVRFAYFSPIVLGAASQSIIHTYAYIVGPLCKIVFIVLYAWILFLIMANHKKWVSDQSRAVVFVAVCGIILLCLYATSRTQVHYTMWLLPFITLIFLRSKLKFRRVLFVSVFLVFLFNLDQRDLNAGLLVPLNPAYFPPVPSLHEAIQPHFPFWGKVIGLARILFSVLCLWMAFVIGREVFSENKNKSKLFDPIKNEC